MSVKLYELAQSYAALMNEMDNENISFEAFADTLDSIKDEIDAKAESIAKMMKTMESDIDMIKAEEKRLSERRKSLENNRNRLKGYLEAQLYLAGIEKVKTAMFTISIQNNPPAVKIIDESVLPESCWVINRTINKQSIAQALKDGLEIPGATLVRNKSLQIR